MLLNALLLALRAIRRNLMRSFLTVLGVVIGVAAVVTMVTLGNGATKMVSDQISSLGSNLLILSPGQRLGPGRDSAGASRFKLADVDALMTQIPSLKAVAPVVGSRVTLGPRSRCVLIQKKWGRPVVCNDGVTIAKEIERDIKGVPGVQDLVANREIRAEHLPDDFFADLQNASDNLPVCEPAIETGDLASQYQACGGNISHLARSLGLSRNTLYKRLREQGLKV